MLERGTIPSLAAPVMYDDASRQLIQVRAVPTSQPFESIARFPIAVMRVFYKTPR